MCNEKEGAPEVNRGPKAGYNPFQGGYSPRRAGHEPTSTDGERLPPAPKGGTGETPAKARLHERAERGNRKKFEKVLEKVPDAEPVEGDEI